ncbi:transmembrane protein, putative [Bodo saltans]|uniref:Transmembrane protein, putative n=1 Tax=Bodo saltans TaxID=75058 RepID=A0A0S4JQE7_BODSA|nr:transmembrane protein, putative [Bodo saltans]|eukprot:CUG91529.1 transmembrane protein, putative [Bodo saltans]
MLERAEYANRPAVVPARHRAQGGIGQSLMAAAGRTNRGGVDTPPPMVTAAFPSTTATAFATPVGALPPLTRGARRVIPSNDVPRLGQEEYAEFPSGGGPDDAAPLLSHSLGRSSSALESSTKQQNDIASSLVRSSSDDANHSHEEGVVSENAIKKPHPRRMVEAMDFSPAHPAAALSPVHGIEQEDHHNIDDEEEEEFTGRRGRGSVLLLSQQIENSREPSPEMLPSRDDEGNAAGNRQATAALENSSSAASELPNNPINVKRTSSRRSSRRSSLQSSVNEEDLLDFDVDHSGIHPSHRRRRSIGGETTDDDNCEDNEEEENSDPASTTSVSAASNSSATELNDDDDDIVLHEDADAMGSAEATTVDRRVDAHDAHGIRSIPRPSPMDSSPEKKAGDVVNKNLINNSHSSSIRSRDEALLLPRRDSEVNLGNEVQRTLDFNATGRSQGGAPTITSDVDHDDGGAPDKGAKVDHNDGGAPDKGAKVATDVAALPPQYGSPLPPPHSASVVTVALEPTTTTTTSTTTRSQLTTPRTPTSPPPLPARSPYFGNQPLRMKHHQQPTTTTGAAMPRHSVEASLGTTTARHQTIPVVVPPASTDGATSVVIHNGSTPHHSTPTAQQLEAHVVVHEEAMASIQKREQELSVNQATLELRMQELVTRERELEEKATNIDKARSTLRAESRLLVRHVRSLHALLLQAKCLGVVSSSGVNSDIVCEKNGVGSSSSEFVTPTRNVTGLTLTPTSTWSQRHNRDATGDNLHRQENHSDRHNIGDSNHRVSTMTTTTKQQTSEEYDATATVEGVPQHLIACGIALLVAVVGMLVSAVGIAYATLYTYQ